jgi:hypothetical protein
MFGLLSASQISLPSGHSYYFSWSMSAMMYHFIYHRNMMKSNVYIVLCIEVNS